MMVTLIESSVLILLVCVVRILFRKVIRSERLYMLWLIVLFRLLPVIPILFTFLGDFKINVLNIMNKGINHVTDSINNWQQSGNTASVTISSTGPARFDISVYSIPWYIIMIWILGTLAILLWFSHVNEKFRRELWEKRVRLDILECDYPVYVVPDLVSPCVFQVRGEKAIYLTEKVANDKSRREMVLVHEICHLKHHDLFWAKVRCFVLALYWVNPLIWLAAILSKEDSEMACDERTIQEIGENRRFEYGRTLVDMISTDTGSRKNTFFYVATTMVSKKKAVKVRVKQIVQKRRKAFWSIGLCVCFLFWGIISCFNLGSEIKGLDPVETVRQYYYYANQGYQKGMKQLSLITTDNMLLPRADTTIIKEYKDVSSEKEYMDYGPKTVNYKEKVVLWLSLEEKYEEKYSGEGGEKVINSEDVVCLIKEEENSDWKIFWGTV